MDIDPTIRAAAPTAPPSHYQAYLNSPGWRTTRNRALRRAGFQCSKCPARRDLEVHHLTYERLGMERDADLEVLCVMCHRGEHISNPDQTSLGIYLKIASAALKNEPFATIADLADMVKTACARMKIPAPEGRINSALALIVGNRIQTPREEYRPQKADPLPVSKGDAREVLIRIFHALDRPVPIKQMPAPPQSRAAQTRADVMAGSRINIDAPVPQPDWGDHDRY